MYIVHHICPQAAVAIEMNQGKEARRHARRAAAKAPSTRKIEDKRRKPEKHKKPLEEQ
jgi:hypothetical protein